MICLDAGAIAHHLTPWAPLAFIYWMASGIAIAALHTHHTGGISGKALALSMLGGWVALPVLLPALVVRGWRKFWDWCIKKVVLFWMHGR
ncbi:MAG: hypothetical protein AAFX78_10220 [Cyanobacteria bacterium J06638_20]